MVPGSRKTSCLASIVEDWLWPRKGRYFGRTWQVWCRTVVRQPPKNPIALSSFFRVRANPIRLTFNLLHPCSTMGEIQVDIYRQYR
jgi:hypothetical protein